MEAILGLNPLEPTEDFFQNDLVLSQLMEAILGLNPVLSQLMEAILGLNPLEPTEDLRLLLKDMPNYDQRTIFVDSITPSLLPSA
ncbi:hypothetical protein QE152_g5954 [Popillia japonica]|uniref:Uncharacterized protein n=1 Tax=Popillia japonica TaxID=7064 RepID=A0AAW1MLA4_POPJA